jgi:subtilisin family serine protease
MGAILPLLPARHNQRGHDPEPRCRRVCDHRCVVGEAVVAHESEEEFFPAWSLPADAVERIGVPVTLPDQVTREWAWEGSTGAGVRVCILDSGVELDHPLVGPVVRSVAVTRGEDGEITVADDSAGDLCGHGTACAGIVRSLAPDVELSSVRVLGEGYTGGAEILLTGLEWAIEQDFDIVNMSLSTSKAKYVEQLRELADRAYFRRTVLVASAHNMPVESFPWRFSSVISVGSHEERSPFTFFYNPTPPVEFFGNGVDLDVAWLDGGVLRSTTGNSFATPHIAAICALILGKHPQLTPFQLKSVLYQTATNAGGVA